MSEGLETKPSRGNYHVVHLPKGSSPKTVEFRTKREMHGFLKKLRPEAIIAIFRGKQLELEIRQVYQVN